MGNTQKKRTRSTPGMPGQHDTIETSTDVMRRVQRDVRSLKRRLAVLEEDLLSADDLKAVRDAREDVRTGKAVRLADYKS